MSELAWQEYTKIADNFQHKVRFEDREDLRQDIILRLAEVASIKTEPLTLPAMLRVANFVTIEFWRNFKRQPTIFSLNETVEDDNGDSVELSETLADDKALDLEAWIDARILLRSCPRRLIRIAHKKEWGKPLMPKERMYLMRYRKKELKKQQQKLL